MLEQLTEELSQLSDFTTGHTCCNIFNLSGAQGNRLSFPARSRYTCEVVSRCALTIHHTASSTGINISMECHTPSSLSQPMVYRASEISQEFLGTNLVNVMINHVLIQSVHCTNTSERVFTKNIRAPTS